MIDDNASIIQFAIITLICAIFIWAQFDNIKSWKNQDNFWKKDQDFLLKIITVNAGIGGIIFFLMLIVELIL